MFGENRGVFPDPPGGGLLTAVELPGQVGEGFELRKTGGFEETAHV